MKFVKRVLLMLLLSPVPPASAEEETGIVAARVRAIGTGLSLPDIQAPDKELARVVTIFRELRSGVTADGKTRVKSPSGTMSTAEAISVMNSGLALAGYFGDGRLRAGDVAAGLVGAVVKDPVQDRVVWQEYLANVLKKRGADWRPLYAACAEHNS